MSNLLATGIAYKALKNDNSEVKTESSPKTLQESIFSKPLTWAIIAGAGIYFVSRFIKKDPLAIEKKDEKSLEQEGQKASYLDSAYKGYADSIYAARSANNLFGTDEDAIYSPASEYTTLLSADKPKKRLQLKKNLQRLLQALTKLQPSLIFLQDQTLCSAKLWKFKAS